MDEQAGYFIAAIFAFYGVMMLVGLGLFVFWIIELVDVCRRDFPRDNDKIVWVLVIALAGGLGAIIYWFVGRPTGWLPGERPKAVYPPPPPATTAPAPPPVAPEDVLAATPEAGPQVSAAPPPDAPST